MIWLYRTVDNMLADAIVNSIIEYMIYKHYERKEHLVYFLIIAIGFYVLSKGYAATTIDNNVQSGGNFLLTSSTSSVIFANGWKIAQSSATTTQLQVTDSASNQVIIFDEN